MRRVEINKKCEAIVGNGSKRVEVIFQRNFYRNRVHVDQLVVSTRFCDGFAFNRQLAVDSTQGLVYNCIHGNVIEWLDLSTDGQLL